MNIILEKNYTGAKPRALPEPGRDLFSQHPRIKKGGGNGRRGFFVFLKRSGGWMLAETICCLSVALTVSACVLDASGAISAISAKSRDKRMRALDYFSLVHEANARFETSPHMKRGEWSASAVDVGTRKGMKVAEIFVVSSEGGGNARWKRWEIEGRE
jgi:hypothetical protein